MAQMRVLEKTDSAYGIAYGSGYIPLPLLWLLLLGLSKDLRMRALRWSMSLRRARRAHPLTSSGGVECRTTTQLGLQEFDFATFLSDDLTPFVSGSRKKFPKRGKKDCTITSSWQ